MSKEEYDVEKNYGRIDGTWKKGTIVDLTEAEMEAMKHGVMPQVVRQFPSGATRNPLGEKIQWIGPDGLISIPALRAYGNYMRTHRKQEGTDVLRAYNNWRQGDGIPQKVCVDSLGRHILDVADLSEGRKVFAEDGHEITMEEGCCAMIFNLFAILNGGVLDEKA